MSEYSVYFDPPGFDPYPRIVKDAVDYVALNAHIERTDVDNIYVKGNSLPNNQYNDRLWIQTPYVNLPVASVRKYISGAWKEFSVLERGDIILVPEENDIIFPWGESGQTYNLAEWGEASFTVPTLPTPPLGFKYKYYIGAAISTPTPPEITP
jgi:hypothetical protein